MIGFKLTTSAGGVSIGDASFQVDPEFEQVIPDDLMGDLQRWLRGDARYDKRPAASVAKHRRL
jgi:hypothetical protein